MIDAIWEFLRTVENTEFATYLREGDLGTTLYLPIFYLLLAFHSVGMAIVVGICFMLTGRMYGYVQSMPLSLIPRLINFDSSSGVLRLKSKSESGTAISQISLLISTFLGQEYPIARNSSNLIYDCGSHIVNRGSGNPVLSL